MSSPQHLELIANKEIDHSSFTSGFIGNFVYVGDDNVNNLYISEIVNAFGVHCNWFTATKMNTDPTLSTMNRSRTMVHIATMINHKRKTMNKSDLVKAIAADTEVSQEKAAKLLDAVTANITNALATGDTVTIVGFGTFRVKDRAARTGRNPKTGEDALISARTVVTFKASTLLADKVKDSNPS